MRISLLCALFRMESNLAFVYPWKNAKSNRTSEIQKNQGWQAVNVRKAAYLELFNAMSEQELKSERDMAGIIVPHFNRASEI